MVREYSFSVRDDYSARSLFTESLVREAYGGESMEYESARTEPVESRALVDSTPIGRQAI